MSPWLIKIKFSSSDDFAQLMLGLSCSPAALIFLLSYWSVSALAINFDYLVWKSLLANLHAENSYQVEMLGAKLP